MKTLTMCGSMRFEKEMRSIAYDLETKCGYSILQCVYAPAGTSISTKELKSLEKAHYRKIDISDGVYIVNIDGYVGESVNAEILYAQEKGKEILYHCNRNNAEHGI